MTHRLSSVKRGIRRPLQRSTRWHYPFSIVAIAAVLYLATAVDNARSAVRSIHLNQLTLAWPATLAQIPPSAVQVVSQGTQVVLNGRSLTVPWSQSQSGIGIADFALMQSFGIELLDTNDATNQPIQWFSQPSTTPLNASTWLTGQYRFLNITGLAQQARWQVNLDRSVLRISTPASRVVGIRQGRQTWGDRLVVDLDQQTPWRITEQSNELLVTIDAVVDPALLQSFRPQSGNRLTSLNVTTNGQQTLVRIGLPSGLRPHVWTLPDPSRVVIDIGSNSLVPRNIAWASGIRWRQQVVPLGNAQFPVVSLELDPRQAGLAIQPITGNASGAVGTTPLITMAQQSQVIAAINGGFFNRNNQLPLGAIRRQNTWLSGPILGRGALGWNDRGEFGIDRLSLQDAIRTDAGRQFSVLFYNTGYVGAGVAAYDAGWGTTYTPIADSEAIITVQDNRVVSSYMAGAAGQGAIAIPTNGYLLVVRAFAEAVNALPVGTGVQRMMATLPADLGRYPNIMGAGPLLVRNRQIVLNGAAEGFSDAFIRQAAVRSVIATTPQGTLVIATVQNRIGGSGPTLAETAQLMQQMGFTNALNLDGGSSTTLYLGGQLLNRPPSSAARVHNGVGVYVRPVL